MSMDTHNQDEGWIWYEQLADRPCALCGVKLSLDHSYGRAVNKYLPAKEGDVEISEFVGMGVPACCDTHLKYIAPTAVYRHMSPVHLGKYFAKKWGSAKTFFAKAKGDFTSSLSALHSCQAWVENALKNSPEMSTCPDEQHLRAVLAWRKMEALSEMERMNLDKAFGDAEYCPVCAKRTVWTGMTKIICPPVKEGDLEIVEEMEPVFHACCKEHLDRVSIRRFKFVPPMLLVAILERITSREMTTARLKYLLSALNSCVAGMEEALACDDNLAAIDR